MEEKELLKKFNKESEKNVPDVYDKVVFDAHAQGLFNGNSDTEAYSDGDTVVLGGVNKKAIAITTCAAVAAVCLAIALPVALSGKYDDGLPIVPPGIDGGDKVVADIELGDSYAIGAVTTARLAESFLNEPATAKAMAARTVSVADFNGFGIYFSALDCFLGDDLVRVATNPPERYQKSMTISGRRVSGNTVEYTMYYTEYKVVAEDYVSGNPVNYYLEGEIFVEGYRTFTLVGERTLASDAEDAEETFLKINAYPKSDDNNTYVQMQLDVEEIDGVTVKNYSYKVVSQNNIVSEADAYKTAAEDLVIKIKEEGTDKGTFTLSGETEDGKGYKGNFDFGRERGEFTVKYTDNGFEYEIAENDILGYKDNGDGTYSVSTYDKTATLPDTLIIPSTHNGKPVVSIGVSSLQGSSVKKVVISEGITNVDTAAFMACALLEEVVFPSTLKLIGNQAFSRCENLKELNLPSSLKTIGQWAFADCSGLTEVVIPNGVEAVSQYALQNCMGLVSISLPASLYNLNSGAIMGCPALEKVTVEEGNPVYHSVNNCIIDTENKILMVGCKTSVVPGDGSVTVIGAYAFAGNGLTALSLPTTVELIQESAFENNDFTSVVLPEGLITIEVRAFAGCTLLKNINFPSTLERICEYAFQWCHALTSVLIPANVQYIEIGAFSGCDALAEIFVDTDNSVYMDSGSNCIIDKATKTITHGCKGSSIPVDGSVVAIGEYAFAYSKIYGITIPSAVKTIGKEAFLNCSLQSGVIMEGVTHIGDRAFSGCYFETVRFSEDLVEIGASAFWGCTELGSIIIPENVTKIGNGAFANCVSLEKVIWASPVQDFGEQVFAGCTKLINFVIPEGTTAVTSKILYNCSSLESITIPKTVTAIDFQALYGCVNLKEIIFTGTEAEWQAIQKDGETWDWDAGSAVGGYNVNCTG